jgi:hypothetical protein
MKTLRMVFIGMFVVVMIVSFRVWSYDQDNNVIDKEKLSDLVNSPRTKQFLVDKIDGIPGVDFDMETIALDFFRENVVVATVDFEYVPLIKHGTASFAYRIVDMEFVQIYSSYWWWGTVVYGDINSDVTWNAAGSPYYVTDFIGINSGGTLSIEPGTVVRFRKFTNGRIGLDVGGTLNCDGAMFTTSCDFEDYDRSQGDESDWSGIWIHDDGACTITDTLIEFAGPGYGFYCEWCTGDVSISGSTVRKCGNGVGLFGVSGTCLVEDNVITIYDTGIYCYFQTASTQITGNTIAGVGLDGLYGLICDESSPPISFNSFSGFSYGVHCENNSSPDVTSNTIENNDYGLYCDTDSLPVVHNNNIEGNAHYGFYNDGSLGTIDAENNWWGDATGPYHPTHNPGGLGDEVSDYVDFDPWLTSAVTVTLASLR